MNGYINTLKTEKDKSEVKKLFETLSRKDNNTVHEVAFMEIDVNKELEESINNIDKNIRKRIFDDILL
jgi:PHP family Zn ribbon phosphoesterase